jgi:hypothetical protein
MDSYATTGSQPLICRNLVCNFMSAIQKAVRSSSCCCGLQMHSSSSSSPSWCICPADHRQHHRHTHIPQLLLSTRRWALARRGRALLKQVHAAFRPWSKAPASVRRVDRRFVHRAGSSFFLVVQAMFSYDRRRTVTRSVLGLFQVRNRLLTLCSTCPRGLQLRCCYIEVLRCALTQSLGK